MEVVKYLVLLFGFVHSSVLPVDKCTLTDKSCMIPAFQKMVPVFVAGMPDLGIEVLDVMKMNDVKFDLSGLQFSLSDSTLKGLKGSVIENVEWDLNKKMFTVEFHFDGYMKGHYTAAGRILVLPISGDGQIKMKLKNLYVKLHIHYDMVKVGDKDHVKLTKYTHEFEVKDNAQFSLSNLFNGNKELSDTLHIFVNENWKQITGEFGKPLVDTATKQIFDNVGKFFEKTPIGNIANV